MGGAPARRAAAPPRLGGSPSPLGPRSAGPRPLRSCPARCTSRAPGGRTGRCGSQRAAWRTRRTPAASTGGVGALGTPSSILNTCLCETQRTCSYEAQTRARSPGPHTDRRHSLYAGRAPLLATTRASPAQPACQYGVACAAALAGCDKYADNSEAVPLAQRNVATIDMCSVTRLHAWQQSSYTSRRVTRESRFPMNSVSVACCGACDMWRWGQQRIYGCRGQLRFAYCWGPLRPAS